MTLNILEFDFGRCATLEDRELWDNVEFEGRVTLNNLGI